MLEPLQKKYGSLGAAVTLAVFGSLWHFIPLTQGNHTIVWVVWQCVVIFLSRFPAVWLYDIAGKSVLVVILFHAMDNVSFALFPNAGSHYDPAVKALTLASVIGVFALMSWSRHIKARTGAKIGIKH